MCYICWLSLNAPTTLSDLKKNTFLKNIDLSAYHSESYKTAIQFMHFMLTVKWTAK